MAENLQPTAGVQRNLRLTLAYDGTDFHGWQRQGDVPTVQGRVEEALERVLGARVSVYGSGRTDAGVHALGQVASFKTSCPIPCPNLVSALNHVLPPTIRITEAREARPEFHARYDARSKTYRYRILQAPLCSPFLWRFVCHQPYPLDRARMAEAAKLVEGEHDFRSFAAADSAVDNLGRSPRAAAASGRREDVEPAVDDLDGSLAGGAQGGTVRTIFSSRLRSSPRAAMLVYEVRGNGFLRHMVRNIAGTLLEVGKGRLAPAELPCLLAARDRALAGPTAPPHGLCLVRVEYDGGGAA